jgi:hypothetical protein
VATATNFGSVTSLSQTGLTLDTSSDVDYYTFTAGSKSTYTVTVTSPAGSGALSLTVLNAQQTVLASSQSLTGGVTLSLSLTSGQQYYVKVFSPTGSVLTYNLSIAKSGGTSGGGGGGHKLVALGVANSDAPVGGDVFYQNAADDPENAGPTHTQIGNAELAVVASAGVALPAAGGFLDVAASQRGPAGPNFGQQGALIVSAATPVLTGVVTIGSAGDVGPQLLPPVTPAESNGGNRAIPSSAATDDGDEAIGPVSSASPAGPPVVDAETVARGDDASEADGSLSAAPPKMEAPAEDSVHVTDAAPTAALAVVLGGYAGVPWVDRIQRTRRGLRR